MPDKSPMETASYISSDWSKPVRVAYNQRDLITYAIGIGCKDLRFTYENDGNFEAFPTYPVVLGFKGDGESTLPFPSPMMMNGAPQPRLPGLSSFILSFSSFLCVFCLVQMSCFSLFSSFSVFFVSVVWFFALRPCLVFVLLLSCAFVSLVSFSSCLCPVGSVSFFFASSLCGMATQQPRTLTLTLT